MRLLLTNDDGIDAPGLAALAEAAAALGPCVWVAPHAPLWPPYSMLPLIRRMAENPLWGEERIAR